MSSRELKRITKRKKRSEVEEIEKMPKPTGQKRFKIERKASSKTEESGSTPETDVEEEEAVIGQEKKPDLPVEDYKGEVAFREDNLPRHSFSPVSFEEESDESRPSDSQNVALQEDKGSDWKPLFSPATPIPAKDTATPSEPPSKRPEQKEGEKKVASQTPSLKSTQRLSLRDKQMAIKKETQTEKANVQFQAEKFSARPPQSLQLLKATNSLSLPQKMSSEETGAHPSAQLQVRLRRRRVLAGLCLSILAIVAAGWYLRLWKDAGGTLNKLTGAIKAKIKGEVTDTSTPSPAVPAASGSTPRLGWFGEEMPSGMSRAEIPGEYIWEKDQTTMVYIPPGEFWDGKKRRELPRYYIDKYELSNEEYERYLKDTGRSRAYHPAEAFRQPQYPVAGITRKEAEQYALWAGKALPTETEWLKAARGGYEIPDLSNLSAIKTVANPMPERSYPWGENQENHRANYRKFDKEYVHTAPIRTFPEGASPYGCINMAGNVWEWCDSESKVCMGGSWNTKIKKMEDRFHPKDPKGTDDDIGARFVVRLAEK